jgi:hypothetical protein
MEKSLGAGAVDPRSSLGHKFREEMIATGQWDSVSKLSRSQAAAFRVEWLEKHHREYKRSKTKTTMWKRIDSDKGVYRNFGQLVISQGGWKDPSAIAGSLKLATQCVQLGHPWTKVHPQTGRTLFLELSFEFQEVFQEAWATHETEMDTGDVVAAPATLKLGDTPAAAMPKLVPDSASICGDDDAPLASPSKPKAKAKPTKHVAEASSSELKKVWPQVLKYKKDFQTAIGAATDLLSQIESVPDWDWAHNPNNHGKLERLLEETKQPFSSFHRRLLTEDPTVLKRSNTPEFLTVEGQAFLATADKLRELQRFTATLVKRHHS